MNKDNTILLIEKAQNQEIDVKATIEHVMSSDYLGLKHSYVHPLDEEDESPKSFPEMMGLSFKDYADSVDDAFFDEVFNYLNEKAIYIPLAFLCPKNDGEFIEYNSRKVIHFDEMLPLADYGIKVDSKNQITFGTYEDGGMFNSIFVKFEADGDEYDYYSLDCPLTQEIVEIIYNNIIFKS